MKKLILFLLIFLIVVGCANKAMTNNELEDTTPPWINVENYVFETEVGNPINYETATAYDETDGPCDVRVVGRVNFNIPGEYYLKYTTKDISGNVSEEPFTVIVYKDSKQETLAENENESEEIKTCDQTNAMDKNKPCHVVVSDLTDYKMIFQDNDGYNRCAAYGDSLIEENESIQYTCEKLFRNDNELWGYGIKVNEK